MVELEKEFDKLKTSEWALCTERGDFFSRKVGLPVSLFITRFFLRFQLTENHASFAMFLTGIAGAILLIFPPWGVLFGALLLLLHHLMDYVDGQLARYYGRASVHGAVLDRWNHFMVETATFPCLALGLSLQNGAAWPWGVVWLLFAWNRLRVLLAQLTANILSDELALYPLVERRMMQKNLAARLADNAARPETETVVAEAARSEKTAFQRIRDFISRMRTASTSYNGFTILLAGSATVDLVLRLAFGITGGLEVLVCLLAAYAVFNMIDYSWTYLSTDRVEREVSSRLE